MRLPIILARGYWCPVCGFALDAHDPLEISECARRSEAGDEPFKQGQS